MTITTTAPTISSTGISAPVYADIYSYLQQQFWGIYGTDADLDPDSQDGQFLAIIANAINDANSTAIAIYNSFSPATSQGAALANNVKLNGLTKDVATNSTWDVLVVGQVGTTITNGAFTDPNNNRWNLPASVTIPSAGQITVTATCSVVGAIAGLSGSSLTIATPTLGWQSVSTSSDATPGAPVETDAALRVRQSKSTAIPSLTVFDGILGAVASITGVQGLAGYENDTGSTDANGLPPHSISLVVNGGDALTIASTIAAKKTPGAYTYGTTSEQITDAYGITRTINFFRPTDQAITGTLTIKALAGYNSTIGAAAQQAISDYVNATSIGGGSSQSVEWDGAIAAAKGITGANTFRIISLALSGPGGAGSPDVSLAFNQMATCTPSAITLSVS